jgi:hypothetical protein
MNVYFAQTSHLMVDWLFIQVQQHHVDSLLTTLFDRRFVFSQFPDMLQHSAMNLVNEQVGPEGPVILRIDIELVPRAPFKSGPALGKRDQPKLPPFAPEVTVQMRGMNMTVWTQFVHGSRLRYHIER